MSLMRPLFWVCVTTLLLLGAAACDGQDLAAAPPGEVVHVVITPAAQRAGLAVSACAGTISGAEIKISQAYASQSEGDLVIRLGEPGAPYGFAAQIAVEELAIILHQDNPASSLTLDQIQALFSGSLQNWAELDGEDLAVQVWSLLPADETRPVFLQTVMAGARLATTANLAPTPQIMADAVAGSPGAIGFLPKSWGTPELTAILPGVRIPVLVVAGSEPQGAARQLVACLQGDIGQEILAAFFSE